MSEPKRDEFAQGNFEGSDENYTPAYAIDPILKHIPKGDTVWCAFDLEQHSEYVKLIRANGNKVIASHIETGQDFFDYEPDQHWDLLVSNPPFKNKRMFFERALSFRKPFALLMNIGWLHDNDLIEMYHNHGKTLQVLHLNDRVQFSNPDGTTGAFNKDTGKRIQMPFNSSYICCDFLQRDNMRAEVKGPKYVAGIIASKKRTVSALKKAEHRAGIEQRKADRFQKKVDAHVSKIEKSEVKIANAKSDSARQKAVDFAARYREELLPLETQASEAQCIADEANAFIAYTRSQVENHQELTSEQEFSRLNLDEQLDEIERINQERVALKEANDEK